LPGGGHVLPRVASFQTAWRVTRTARRVAPLIQPHYIYRLTGRPLPPGAPVPVASLL